MEPKFHEEDLIYVDPNYAAMHGKYVVVKPAKSNEPILRQLVIEGDRKYLKAMNPDWPNRIIEFKADATICGVVLFKGERV